MHTNGQHQQRMILITKKIGMTYSLYTISPDTLVITQWVQGAFGYGFPENPNAKAPSVLKINEKAHSKSSLSITMKGLTFYQTCKQPRLPVTVS